MKRIRQPRSVFLVVAMLALVAIAGPAAPEALAQYGQETKQPPTPSSRGNPPALLQYGVLVVLAMGVVGLGILKSKREVRN